MTPLQTRLFAEHAEGALFELAVKKAAAHLSGVMERRPFPTPDAIAALTRFDVPLPEEGLASTDILTHLHETARPATTELQGGRYFGFVNGGALPVALAARLMVDSWDQNAALAVMSPATAALEEVVEGWLADLLGLPKGTAAGFVTGSSIAILCGLAAARWRLLMNAGWDVNARGLNGAPPLRVVTSDQAHSAVLKALRILGFGTDCIETVPSDDQGRIMPDAVPALDAQTLLLLQAGHVASGAFDPLEALVAEARRVGAWVHVDGAFGLWAAASPRLAPLTAGMAGAHSFSADAHKTLNVPYDSGVVLCSDREALTTALIASGSYLAQGTGPRDGMRFAPDMSRRARVFEIYAALAALGRTGVAELVEMLADRAQQFGRELTAAGFKVPNDIVFNQCLVMAGSDAETEAVMAGLQASGIAWAGGCDWQGRRAIRLSVCSWATTEADVTCTVEAMVHARKSAAR